MLRIVDHTKTTSTCHIHVAHAAQPRARPALPTADKSNNVDVNVAMLGAGNMGGAMLQGWLHSGAASADHLAACVRSESSQSAWRALGFQVCSTWHMCLPCTHTCARASVVATSALPSAPLCYYALVANACTRCNDGSSLLHLADMLWVALPSVPSRLNCGHKRTALCAGKPRLWPQAHQCFHQASSCSLATSDMA
jgi:hypothetical protein